MSLFNSVVSAVVGAVAAVANAIGSAVKSIVSAVSGKGSQATGGIESAASGAMAIIADVFEDGEIDEDEEELLEEAFKLLVGAFIPRFGSDSSDLEKYISEEKIVISGNKTGEYHTRNFIETAIKQIKDWKANSDTDLTWIVVDSGYTNTDKNLMKLVAKDNGVNLMFIDNREDLVNYINEGKDNDGNIIEYRSVNKITDISIFAHGLRDGGGVLALNYENGGDLNISANELKEMNIDKEAFLNPHTYFGSCNAGTVVDGTSFANEWVNKIGGEGDAICDPTPESKEKGGQTSYYEINDINFKFRIEDKVRKFAGINFNTEGCNNYPVKHVNEDNKDMYEDIYWERIYEDGHTEQIDIGGPRR